MANLMSQKGDMQACIRQCLKCYEICTRTVAAALEVNEDQDFITALQLCSQACQLSAQAMMLDSVFYSKTCALCAELCEGVSELCESFDEPEMRECGQVCRDCAKSCRSMIHIGASNQTFQSDIRLV